MYSKLPYLTAQDITQRYQPSPEVETLLENNPTPEQLIGELNAEKNFADLVMFMAHGLPPREGIGWAIQCIQEIIDDCVPAEKVALATAKEWYINPTEKNRRDAERAANKAELQTAPGWVAQAVFWTGGSMTAPGTPVISPPPFLYCHAIAGAVNLAAILPDGLKADERYLVFIEKAINIAHGSR
ncbi:hypothetical protein M3P05_14315 [Sansalvadorimonas sp. 2012CJ34-2]|uniref:Twin-arginine translocation pathway signal n=1 Tax=Parendozoicomonas callyspongiae TaxID=2942213 RepID=A0ABT0PIP2_9GAMM|nr:hypothetical protein [Sansalvadorimonas sp. 2012CJ34-2]MCL6271096.1 hypothetical protein [Sansalvadorimonas sp. 2012CJ34-2]